MHELNKLQVDFNINYCKIIMKKYLYLINNK